MRDGEHAIAMSNALSHYLPVVLALSVDVGPKNWST
jgi:gamma-glutamyl:cysteine ligase YbdK (ATP-grasp superfamily)